MVWITFLLYSSIIILCAIQLAKYGDVLADKTGIGKMFMGVLLIAGVTSLPELFTSINAVQMGYPNLAVGNLLGSNAFNMLLLAVLDILFRNKRILRNAALKHAVSGSLTVFLITITGFFILANIPIHFGPLGLDSLIIMICYIGAMYLVEENISKSADMVMVKGSSVGWMEAIFGFGFAAIGIILVSPYLVSTSENIARITGLGNTFIGTTLMAGVTSMPEMITMIAAVRLGSEDMAIGNLFGSNMFNIFVLAFSDGFYTQGRLLHMINPSMVYILMLGLLLTTMALIGNLARWKRRIAFIELDVVALIVVYFLGMWLLYSNSIAV
jgi:cation:H+ antiporter